MRVPPVAERHLASQSRLNAESLGGPAGTRDGEVTGAGQVEPPGRSLEGVDIAQIASTPRSPVRPGPRPRRDDPDLAVTDAAGLRGLEDDVDDRGGVHVVDEHLDAALRDEVDGVLGAAVDLAVATLAAVAVRLADGHALDAEGLEASFTSSSWCGLMMAVTSFMSWLLRGSSRTCAVAASGAEAADPIGHRRRSCRRPTRRARSGRCRRPRRPRGPPAHGRLEGQGDDEGDDTRDDERGEGDEDLDDGLVDAATVEQTGGGREQARADGAPEAGDEVHADDVERVVVAEAELQADGEGRGPATTPRMIEPSRLSAPQAGVMATRPATTPEAAPTEVAWPSRTFSTMSQPIIAAQVATVVLIHTRAAVSSAASSGRR